MFPTSLRGDAGADVLAAQEQATASKFSEVKIRLAADAHAMNQYNLELNKTAGKQHVAKVLHEKTQLATGKKSLVVRCCLRNFVYFCLTFKFNFYCFLLCLWS